MSVPIKAKLTIKSVGERQAVPDKAYQKLAFDATTEKSGDTTYTFITYKSRVMDAVEQAIGKTIECMVHADDKTVDDVIGDITSKKDISIECQVGIKAVTDLLATGKEQIFDQDTIDDYKVWVKRSIKRGLE